jgi:hypothetical protein
MSLFPHGRRSGMFIRASARSVTDCLVEWGNEKVVGRRTTAKRKRIPLKEAWNHVSERRFQPDRGIVVPMTGQWSAFLTANC